MQTVEAEIDANGKVRLREALSLKSPRRALIIILDEDPAPHVSETALLSQTALEEDWNRPEEDAAWSHAQAAGKPPFKFSDTGGKYPDFDETAFLLLTIGVFATLLTSVSGYRGSATVCKSVHPLRTLFPVDRGSFSEDHCLFMRI